MGRITLTEEQKRIADRFRPVTGETAGGGAGRAASSVSGVSKGNERTVLTQTQQALADQFRPTVSPSVSQGRSGTFQKNSAGVGTFAQVREMRENRPSGLERAGLTVLSGLKGMGTDFGSTVTTLYETGQKNRDAQNQDLLRQYQEDLSRAKRDMETMQEMMREDPETWGGTDLQIFQNAIDAAQQKVDAMTKVTGEKVQEKATEAAYEAGEQWTASAEKDRQRAKEGLGTLGQVAVDAGVAGTQMLGDIALGVGTGGGTKLAMAGRVFGGGAQEARAEGADLGEQVGYGAASAAAAVLTEQLSNLAAPFSKAFGKGFADDMAEDLIQRTVDKLAGTAAGKTALQALLRTGTSAAGEGLEEMVEDAINPVLKLIYQSDSREGALENLRRTYGENFDASEMLYDGLIGAILGGVGGTVDTAMNAPGNYRQYRRQAAEDAAGEINAIYDGLRSPSNGGKQTGDSDMDGAGNTATQAVRDPYDITPRLDEGVEGPLKTGRVTTIYHPYQGKVPVQGQKNSASVRVDRGSVQMAEGRIEEARSFAEDSQGQGFKAALKNIYKSLFRPVKGVPVEGVTFEGKPYTVDINSNVPGKVISDRNLTAEKLALLDILPEVVRNGEYVGSGEYVQHGARNKPVIRYDYFETPVSIYGENYVVKFDVEVFPSSHNYRTHQIVNVGLTPTEARLAGPAPVPSSVVSSPHSNDSLPQGAGAVNGGRNSYDITPRLDEGGVVVPEANNYRTHQPINMDLTRSEAKLTGRDPALSSNLSGPIEETRPLNDEYTISQRADAVNGGRAARGSGALDTLGVHVAGDMGEYRSTAQLRGMEEGRKKTVRARQQAERRLNPTRAEKAFARGIAEGDYTAAEIPASMARSTVVELADYYAAENSFKQSGVKTRGQEIRQETEQLARDLIGEDQTYRKIPMLLMNEKTPERVMRSLFGYEKGEEINRSYIYPVQQNEAEKLRFINRMFDQVRTFQDSRGQESALTRQERSLVQQMLEDRFVGETVASMEMGESIRKAAENIHQGKDAADTAREFGLRGEEKELARRLSRWMENQEILESGKADSVKINNAVEAYSRQYDLFYDAINDFLTAHGYSTIGFIKGYAPHMQGADTQNKLQSVLRSMGVNTGAVELPASISGLTSEYKPGKRWNPFFQTRQGSSTDYDAAAGYESYVTYLADIFYHTDDIARLRGLSRYLRKTYGPEEISHAIDHAESLRNMDTASQMEALKDAGRISRGTTLTAEDTRAELESYIDELYGNIENMTRYSEFVKYIDNYANILAGKQSMADRGMEYTAGRTSLNVGNKLVSAFARAQVAGNVSSALNQSAQLAQLMAEVDGRSIAKAAAELARSTGGKLWNIKAAELFDQSDLLTTKKGIEYLTAEDSRLDRFITTLFKPADTMDSLISALTVQSKYEQLRSQGMEHSAAMEEANRFATSIMASRAKGSRPLAFESKNLISQMLHMFQVEAVNSWDHIAQDLPQQYRSVAAAHGKKAAGRALATVATKGLLSAFLLNRITEAAYGGTPAPFDVLGWISNFVASGLGMSTNAWLQTLVDAGWEKLTGEPLFGGDDEDQKEEPFNWERASDDLVYNLLNDIPFVRNAVGLLGLGDQTMPLTNIAEAVQGVGEAADNAGILSGEMGGALLTLGASMLPGGRQIQKTAQGVQTILNQGRMYGYGEDQRLQYPVERDPFNIVQALLFGNSGLSESRDFYASGDAGLSAKQTQVLTEMGESGADRRKVYEAIQAVRNGTTTEEKLLALSEAALSDEEKLQIYESLIASSGSRKPGDLRTLMEAGTSWEQIMETYPFASTSDAEKYMVYVEEYGFSPETAAGLVRTLRDLRPKDGEQSVSSLQRYRAVVDYGLSQQEQLAVLQGMMTDSEYESMMEVGKRGITPEQYITFREETSSLSADKTLAGTSIPGSLKRKVLDYIDAIPNLNNAQKNALYFAAGYAESTLDDAPWYGRSEKSWDIVPRLDQ